MSNSRKQPVRSARLVAQHGVGSLIVGKGGVSFIVAGLDAWFADSSAAGLGGAARAGANSSGFEFDEGEFIVREPRLEARLGVGSFRTPPEYRKPRRGTFVPNTNLTIPILRFPQWHMCARCGLMEFLPLTQTGRVFCRDCRAASDFFSELAQMPFVALCERGHLQDFPWREWAHREHEPQCGGDLYYLRSGSGTLAGQKIKCQCGAVRSLLNIDKANFSDTYLSFHLAKKGGIYTCRGHRPWLGETVGTERCHAYLRGNLRNAGNVFFAQTVSAIALPENGGGTAETSELRHFLAKPEIAAKLRQLKQLGEENTVRLLKIFYPAALRSFGDEQIERALNFSAALVTGDETGGSRCAVPPAEAMIVAAVKVASQSPETVAAPVAGASPEISPAVSGETGETEFRYAEFQVLRAAQDNEALLSRRVDLLPASGLLATGFARILQIHRLRETRVYTGFSRIHSDNALPLKERRRMLRRESPETENAVFNAEGEFAGTSDWLPATTVFGEGIYFEFDEGRLRAWEEAQNRGALARHLAAISDRIAAFRKADGEATAGTASERLAEMISPRFILIHTFAHLLINQLAFESGYSSSAIRERLYVSGNQQTRMNGLLLYTADGDSSGTLGGLVRLGTPGYLEKLLARIIDNARWCASDPACSEIGVRCGQGPDNRNLAACHACALVPETSCEQFNQFLDRALLVNLAGSEVRGFFEVF